MRAGGLPQSSPPAGLTTAFALFGRVLRFSLSHNALSLSLTPDHFALESLTFSYQCSAFSLNPSRLGLADRWGVDVHRGEPFELSVDLGEVVIDHLALPVRGEVKTNGTREGDECKGQSYSPHLGWGSATAKLNQHHRQEANDSYN
jgi:hypothetical protein